MDEIETYLKSDTAIPTVRFGHTHRRSRSCIVARVEGKYLNKHHQQLLDELGQTRITGNDVVDRSAAHELMLEVQHATCCSYVCNAS